MKPKTDILIIGAGISGTSAAQELQAQGADYLLLEQNMEPGGLTRSISIGEAIFDYTGHFLHLVRCKNPEELPYAKQNNQDWQLIQRKSVVYLNGEIVPAPFQYNLHALSQALRTRCISDFRSRPSINPPRSFKDYLLSGFGHAICEVFLFPYNEKQLCISLENLSVDAVKRFFPYPDEEKIESGSIQGSTIPHGYNRHFWYPKNTGIGILGQGLAEGLTNLKTSVKVEGIDLEKKIAHTSYGDISYQYLITSAPLKWFCSNTNIPRVRRLARLLTHNREICVNLLFRGSFHKDFEDCHWIYVPDKTIPFHRVGIYSNISNSKWPTSRTALYVELAYPESTPIPSIDSILNDVLASLERLKWVRRKDCIVMCANWIDCAYVHFDHNRQKAVNDISEILKSYDVHLIGRYGLWDYISMEDSIFSGIEVARKLKG